jgi:hypothetical protein
VSAAAPTVVPIPSMVTSVAPPSPPLHAEPLVPAAHAQARPPTQGQAPGDGDATADMSSGTRERQDRPFECAQCGLRFRKRCNAINHTKIVRMCSGIALRRRAVRPRAESSLLTTSNVGLLRCTPRRKAQAVQVLPLRQGVRQEEQLPEARKAARRPQACASPLFKFAAVGAARLDSPPPDRATFAATSGADSEASRRTVTSRSCLSVQASNRSLGGVGGSSGLHCRRATCVSSARYRCNVPESHQTCRTQPQREAAAAN